MLIVNAKNSSNSDYVSRAEGKLAHAVRAFSYNFRNKTALDIGSSTGGFTELALKLGAKKVIAVEKGTRQMKAPLRFDQRIELHEKTDFFDFEARRVDTILADVSFVSLKKILKHARNFADYETDFLVMLKPQFEAREEQMLRGVIKNEKIRREILRDFEGWLKANKFFIVKKQDNNLRGKNGNLERFYWLKLAK